MRTTGRCRNQVHITFTNGAALFLPNDHPRSAFTNGKTGRVLLVYHAGLNLTGVMFLIRGVVQVMGTPLSSGVNAAISGMAGIGHILLGVSMVLLLVQIKKSVRA